MWDNISEFPKVCWVFLKEVRWTDETAERGSRRSPSEIWNVRSLGYEENHKDRSGWCGKQGKR